MRIYLKIGKKNRGYKVVASDKPDPSTLMVSGYPSNKPIPTVSFAVDIDIPERAFQQNEEVIGRIVIPESRIRDLGLRVSLEEENENI